MSVTAQIFDSLVSLDFYDYSRQSDTLNNPHKQSAKQLGGNQGCRVGVKILRKNCGHD